MNHSHWKVIIQMQSQNNLIIFINGMYQEPGVAYTLTGSIIEFSEAPRANSGLLIIYIYTGSDPIYY